MLLSVAAWLVPGAGHLWLGRREKGLIFLAMIPLMFVIGLWLQGAIFPFQTGEPLAGLAIPGATRVRRPLPTSSL